ncbi:MAG TPA: signal peptidase I, partial [Candidatus Paceibacterota bacterium]|nr:signal peptidase I [Candidatus Paceibacterota bacterium]
LVRIVILVLLVFAVRQFALLPIRIFGPSMMPTYQENGINMVNRLAYLRAEPQRGDVVAIRYAGEHRLLMKRILALPGETIEFRNGKVLINGEILPEPYLAKGYPSDWTIPLQTVKPDHYYVVGDNRTMPEELHVKGQAERRRIVGKVLLCKNLFASSSPRR